MEQPIRYCIKCKTGVLKRQVKKFCSYKCMGDAKKGIQKAPYKDVKCLHCPTVMTLTKGSKKKYCSRTCANQHTFHLKRDKLLQANIGKKHTTAQREARSLAYDYSTVRIRRRTYQYKGINFDSTWEVALAKRLIQLKIKWTRKTIALPWIDSQGIRHNYKPDFYLPCLNLTLEVKSPHIIKIYPIQKQKYDYIRRHYPEIIFLWSLKQCQQFHLNERTL